ncbi:MAG: TRAP transporter small permease [Deltaproteobacteria bacterium]|nr:TRAP transporter small permease [Deltaproteobacteria bacterium]
MSPFIPYKVATMIHLRKVYDFINRISLYGAYLAAVMGGLLILVVLAEIVRRTVFGSSFLWTFEISSWLLVGFAFMGMGYTLQSGGHVRVTLLTNRLSEMSRTRLDMALALVGAGMFGYLSVFFFENMVSNYEVDARGLSILEPPVFIIWAAGFFGLVMFSLQFLGVFLGCLLKLLGKGSGDERS